MTTRYKPNLSTSGIGSLPFKDGREAVEFILGADLDVPFWPQLPNRGFREHMVPQYSENMPGIILDPAAETVRYDSALKYADLAAFLDETPGQFNVSENYAAGLYAFMNAAKSRPWLAVKGQVTGPITFTTGIVETGKEMLYADLDLRDAAVKLLGRKAQWQVEQFRTFAGTVIIFVDEPVLSAFGSSTYVGISEKNVIEMEKEVFEAIRSAGGLGGIHVCGNSDWSVIIRTTVDVLNFDAYRYGAKLALYGRDVHDFLDRGGCIAWGLVPTTPDELRKETCGSLVEQFKASVEALTRKGIPETLIFEQSLLTPSCGCGSLSIEETRTVFSLLQDVRNALR